MSRTSKIGSSRDFWFKTPPRVVWDGSWYLIWGNHAWHDSSANVKIARSRLLLRSSKITSFTSGPIFFHREMIVFVWCRVPKIMTGKEYRRVRTSPISLCDRVLQGVVGCCRVLQGVVECCSMLQPRARAAWPAYFFLAVTSKSRALQSVTLHHHFALCAHVFAQQVRVSLHVYIRTEISVKNLFPNFYKEPLPPNSKYVGFPSSNFHALVSDSN